MPGGTNLAIKYSKVIDERWTEGSALSLVNNKYDFKGDKTVEVYSIPTAPLHNYTRSGMQRYGVPDDLGRNIQTLTVSQDKGFTFVIDEGDYVQSEFVMNSGSALDRQIRNVIVPDFDEYCFKKIYDYAIGQGFNSITVVNKTNAQEMLLQGLQKMADMSVPISEVVCYATYSFYSLMMQDSSFMRYGNLTQQMLNRGELGEADGVKMVRVPATRLPAGTAFMLVHKEAIVAPHQLQSFITHKNPVGVNGTVCEGRVIYDCFALSQKAGGLYVHMGQSGLKPLRAEIMWTANGKLKIVMYSMKQKSGNTWYAKSALDQSALPAVSYTTAIDPSSGAWSGAMTLTSEEYEFTPTSGHTRIRIAECGSNSKPIGYVDLAIPDAPLS